MRTRNIEARNAVAGTRIPVYDQNGRLVKVLTVQAVGARAGRRSVVWHLDNGVVQKWLPESEVRVIV